MVRSHKFPKPPWHAVGPQRGAAAVVETVGRRWEAVVGTAVDPERGAAAVVMETVGLRWGAVGTAVALPNRWSQWTLGWLCCSSGYNREQQQDIRIGDSLFSFLFFLLSVGLAEMFCPERWRI